MGTTARGGGLLSTSAPYGQATLQGSVHMLFETAKLVEFGKVDDSIDKQFDPSFPMRRIVGSEVVHDAAYAVGEIILNSSNNLQQGYTGTMVKTVWEER